jgi:hypothetical protein
MLVPEKAGNFPEAYLEALPHVYGGHTETFRSPAAV